MSGAHNGIEPLDGFRVISPSGKVIGEVAGLLDTAIVVEVRRLGRSLYRPLPRDLAIAEHAKSSVSREGST
jgi:hypothetical protein